MSWFRRLMYGRYGNDGLNTFLLILYFILALMYVITKLLVFWILSLVPILLMLWRMFSRNFARRRAENQAFSGLLKPFVRFFKPLSRMLKTKLAHAKDNTHRYFRCPSCKATLRVPRNVGKIEITCPACKNKITRKT